MNEGLTLKKLSAAYEVAPSEFAWRGINEKLDDLDRKRRRGIIWFFLLGVLATGFASYFIIRQDELKTGNYSNHSSINTASAEQVAVNSNSAVQPKSDESLETNGNNKINSKSNILVSVKNKKQEEASREKLIVNSESKDENIKVNSTGAITISNTNSKSENPVIEPGKSEMSMQPVAYASIISIFPDYIASIALDTTSRYRVEAMTTLSRWSVRIIAGPEFINHDRTKSSSENEIPDKNFTSTTITVGMQKDFTDFRIFAGINYHKTGMISEQSEIRLVDKTAVRTPTVPVNEHIYEIATSAGTLIGTASDFEDIYFDSPDSSLFPVLTSVAAPNQDSVTVRDVTLKSEFEFISVPVQVFHNFSANRFSPYVSGGFTVGYMISDFRRLNGSSFAYEYKNELNRWQFAIEFSVGLNYRLGNRLTLEAGTTLMRGLNSISTETKWMPSSVSVNAGIQWRLLRKNQHSKF